MAAQRHRAIARAAKRCGNFCPGLRSTRRMARDYWPEDSTTNNVSVKPMRAAHPVRAQGSWPKRKRGFLVIIRSFFREQECSDRDLIVDWAWSGTPPHGVHAGNPSCLNEWTENHEDRNQGSPCFRFGTDSCRPSTRSWHRNGSSDARHWKTRAARGGRRYSGQCANEPCHWLDGLWARGIFRRLRLSVFSRFRNRQPELSVPGWIKLPERSPSWRPLSR